MGQNIPVQQIVIGMIEAAKLASPILLNAFLDNEQARYCGKQLDVTESKNDFVSNVPDFVTRYDREAELAIKTHLSKKFPDISFVGEECGGNPTDKPYFLVDPCDGTTNFALGVPYFATSLALVEKDTVIAGVISSPHDNKFYWSVKGDGAYIVKGDDATLSCRIYANQGSDLKKCLLLTEESFGNAAIQSGSLDRLASFSKHVAGVRKFGSTALDLALLASGMPVISLSSGLKSWDFAAGALIAEEAGACVRGWDNKPADLKADRLLCAPKSIYNKISNLIRMDI